MKTIYKALGLILITFTASCASNKSATNTTSSPSWIQSSPADTESFLLAAGQGESAWQGAALRNAQHNATEAMVDKLGSKVSALEKLFKEEISKSPNANYDTIFSTLSSELAQSEEVQGVKRARAECIQLNHKGTANSINQRCFVLVRMPTSEARAVIEKHLSKNKELYAKLQATGAFDKLQHNLHEL